MNDTSSSSGLPPTPSPEGDLSLARQAMGGSAATPPAAVPAPSSPAAGNPATVPAVDNIIAERAYASHAMEGENHRRVIDPRMLTDTSGDLSILLAKQRQLAEAAMEGEERRKAREAAEAETKVLADAARKKKEDADRLAAIKAQEQAELKRITEEARLKQHSVLAAQQTTVDTLVKTPTVGIRPVRTLKEDMDSAIKGNNLSMVSIAIKEDEKRREEAAVTMVETKKNHWFGIIAGILVVTALGLLGYVGYARFFAATPEASLEGPVGYEPMVFAEKIKTVAAGTLTDTQLISILKNEVKNLNAPVGTVEDVHFVEADNRPDTVTFQRWITLLRLTPPDSLLRNLQQSFMFGVHSAAENGGFLVVTPQNYERVFAGMLAWEPTMLRDLAVILSGKTPDAELLRLPFSDLLIKNVSARAVRDSSGRTVLLYAFFNKDTLIITSNEATFVEVITRLTTPRPRISM